MEDSKNKKRDSIKRIVYLLDASASMREDPKIPQLNEAMSQLVNLFEEYEAELANLGVVVSVYLFGGQFNEYISLVGAEWVKCNEFQWEDSMKLTKGQCTSDTPLGEALVNISNILEEQYFIDQDGGYTVQHAPLIVVISDGLPTRRPDREGEYAVTLNKDEFQEWINKANKNKEFRRSIRACIVVGQEAGSEAEKTLFSLVQGSHSIPIGQLQFNVGVNEYEDLIGAVKSATLGGTLGKPR